MAAPEYPPVALHLVCINADPTNSLGGSVARDIANINEHLKKQSIGQRSVLHRHVHTVASVAELQKIAATVNADIRQQKALKANAAPVPVVIMLYVSGHGQQLPDQNGDEADGLDEAIPLVGGVVRDDDIKSMVVDKLRPVCDFMICIADTCHSGSMFDLKYSYNFSNRQWTPSNGAIFSLSVPEVLSISACADSQMASCDIGETSGFGGALTLQLIDSKVRNGNVSLIQYIVSRAVQAVLKEKPYPIADIIHALEAIHKKLQAAYGQTIVMECQ